MDQAGKGSQSWNGKGVQVSWWVWVRHSVQVYNKLFIPSLILWKGSEFQANLIRKPRGSLPRSLLTDPQMDMLAFTTQHGSPPPPTFSGGQAGCSWLWASMLGTEHQERPTDALRSRTPLSPLRSSNPIFSRQLRSTDPCGTCWPTCWQSCPKCPGVCICTRYLWLPQQQTLPWFLGGSTTQWNQDFFLGRA